MLNATQGFTYNKFEKPNDWPKIDETFDYKIENGKLLSANEHIYLSGPVTYTIVGSPTIVDGVASNFSSSNYLTLPSENIKNFTEIVVKFRMPSSALNKSKYNMIFTRGTFRMYVYSYETYFGSWGFDIPEVGSLTSSTHLQADTDYWIKYTRNENLFTLFYSTDGTNWTSANTKTGTISSEVEGTSLIGTRSNTSQYFEGSIDLNQTYIKVNGKLWFYGKNYTTKNMVPVPAGLEYNNTIAPSIGWVNTNTDRVKGPVNYTLVGSPTIVNGVASGFSATNSLRISSSIDVTKPFEIFMKINTSDSNLLQNIVMLKGTSSVIAINATSHKPTFLMRYYGTDDLLHSTRATIQSGLENNTTYYLKGVCDTNGVSLSVSTDKTNWNTVTTPLPDDFVSWQVPSMVDLGGYDLYYFAGSIDLNETYIKVNGQPWFGNCPSEFQQFTAAPQGTMIGKDDTHNLIVETPIVNGELLSPKLVGPVGYTVVGSPTIVDGVASDFASYDYIICSSTYLIDEDVIASIKTKINAGSTGIQDIFAVDSADGTSLQIAFSETNAFRFRYKTSSLPSDFTVSWIRDISFVLGNWIVIKISYNSTNKNLVLSFYQDEVLLGEKTYSDVILPFYYCYFGRRYSGSPLINGSIDLNETYIKVNGKLWFGKEDWKPSTYTDNAIYLLGSHSTDYSSYNTQGINPTIETESDESGTYNVWIDNQEIYKEQSNPLDINWSNLALTTGYNITTPSTLKAHVIKVEPNNGNITRFSADTNYKVENGLLTWASPKLYLEGPTQYTVVGNPTIVDGIASGFSANNFLQLAVSINRLSVTEIVLNFNVPSSALGLNNYMNVIVNGSITFYLYSPNTGNEFIYAGFYLGTDLRINHNIPADTNFWVKYTNDGTTCTAWWSLDGENYTAGNTLQSSVIADATSQFLFGANQSGWRAFAGSIDLNETYIKVNNELWFGKIYTSETDVPVPANFTYGNTTTSSNGTVNLTTQEFSADTLATYGKDS